MSRPLDDVSAAETKRMDGPAPHFAVFLDFPDDPVYAWSGLGDISFNGQTWSGVGGLGQISGLVENSQLNAESVTFTLTGIPSANHDLVRDSLSTYFLGRRALIYILFVDEIYQIKATPRVIWAGRMDVPTITDDGQSITINLTAENILVGLGGSSVSYYTDEDQQARHPGDRFFEYNAAIQGRPLYWGRAAPGK